MTEMVLQTKTEVNIDHWAECERQWLTVQSSGNTRRAYERAWQDFGETCPVPMCRAGRREVVDWVTSLRERGLKKSTINSRVAAISSFYSFAMTYTVNGLPLVESNPALMKGIREKVTPYKNSRALSTAEVKKLLAQMDQRRITGLRDYALISGYIILGRRNTEWRLARLLDFEMQDDKIYYRYSGKGKEDELLEVPDDLWRILANYITVSDGRGPFDYIFLDRDNEHTISAQRVRDMVQYYADKAGIGKLRVHDLRHTAAMLRREMGADVEEIREFLRHSSLATTQYYLHRLQKTADERASAVCKAIF